MAVIPFDPPYLKIPVLHANITSLYRTRVSGDRFYIAGIGIFDVFGSCDLDLDSMTFIYKLDP